MRSNRRACRVLGIGVVFLLGMTSAAVAESNWPQFRGAESLGVAESANLPDRWSATENVQWKQDVPGLGWSSPIVWGNRVFLTTVVNQGETEPPKKGLYFGGDRKDAPTSVHQWKVYCLDLASGSVVWEQTPHEGVPESTRHLKNTFASETPVTDGELVYAYFGNLGLFCYDLAGKPLWSVKLPAYKTRYGWGTAASPVVFEDRVYLAIDNDEQSSLVALDKRTGEEVWKVARDEKSNWATPYIWKNEKRTEMVIPGTGAIRSYDLAGNELWRLGGMSSIAIPTPFSKFGLLYVASGYIMDKKKPLYAVRPGASGDISLADDQSTNDFVAWSEKMGGPYNPSPLIYGDHLYVLLDRGFLECYDAKTGQRLYEKQRLPEGKAFTSSPWAYSGKIFCINEDGLCFVVKAGPEFEILHTNALTEDDMCMATPAIVGDKLLVRTAPRVYCIAQGKKSRRAGRAKRGPPNVSTWCVSAALDAPYVPRRGQVSAGEAVDVDADSTRQVLLGNTDHLVAVREFNRSWLESRDRFHKRRATRAAAVRRAVSFDVMIEHDRVGRFGNTPEEAVGFRNRQ